MSLARPSSATDTRGGVRGIRPQFRFPFLSIAAHPGNLKFIPQSTSWHLLNSITNWKSLFCTFFCVYLMLFTANDSASRKPGLVARMMSPSVPFHLLCDRAAGMCSSGWGWWPPRLHSRRLCPLLCQPHTLTPHQLGRVVSLYVRQTTSLS